MTDPRYAIYYAPEADDALARFGWAWLGRDPRTADDAPFLPIGLEPERHARIVADPRLYGLHATLKAPFRLVSDVRRIDLVEALARFSATSRPIEVPPLGLGAMDRFLVLRPSAAAPELDRLAARCVESLDRFRAPATAAETSKRSAAGISEHQRKLMDRWGYPYVMDEFRFHVTLTGRLGESERKEISQLLSPHLIGVTAAPLQVGSLCLFEQPGADRRFVLAARFPLGA